MKLKASQNKWFIAFIVAAVVAVAAIVVAMIGGGQPKGPQEPVYVTGPKVGVYYYDVVDGEVLLTLSNGGNFTIAGPRINKTGTYTVDGANMILDFFKDEDGTTTATINGDAIALVYDNATMQFIKKVDYTVTFHVDGGNQIAAVTVVNGKTLAKPADPTKENAVFLGWYADEALTVPFDFATTTVTADINIYARWANKQLGTPEYTIELDLGYEGAGALETITTIGGIAYDIPTPERAGYTFGGWWISMYEDGAKLSYAYTEKTMFTADTTLFAVWHENNSAKLTAPSVTVSGDTISWNTVKDAASYKLTIVGPDGNLIVDNETVGATTRAFNFAEAKAGEYKISVVAVAGNEEKNSDATVRYYANKTLDRVSNFSVVNGILIFGTVENAQKYTITIDCGNDNHVHTAFDNGSSTNYYIGNCPMQEGGILITVTASANGYASSTSKVFVYNKVLDRIDEVVYDKNNDKFVWSAVPGTATYYVTVTIDGQDYTFDNGSNTSFSMANFSGDITISVVPATEGYNSPEATVATCKKTAPAAPSGVTASGMVISWDPVAGATAYTVNIGGQILTVNTNQLNMAEANLTLAQGQFYTVKVQAVNANNESSSYSAAVQMGYYALDTALTYQRNTLSWSPVLGVSKYQVRVNGGAIQNVTDVTSARVVLTKEGENLIEVRYVSGDSTSEWASITVTAYAVEYDTRSVAYGSFFVEYLAVGDEMTLPTTGFALDGYDFTGWYNAPKGAAGNGKRYDVGAVFTGSAYTVVYAEWAPKPYHVTLKTEGFDITNIENGTVESVIYTKHFTLTVPQMENTGMYSFAGWYTGPNGTGVQITDENGKSLVPYNVTRDLTLYPYYSTTALTFTLQADGTYAVTRGPSIKGVEDLVIPASYREIPVTKILESAFSHVDCLSLQTVQIPDTITLVGASAFTSCRNLKSIEVYKAKEGNYEVIYSSIDGVLIREDMGTTYLEVVPRAKTGDFVIPASVEKILTKAFYYSSLDSVTIPNTVTAVPKYAFYACSSMKTVVFSAGRTNPIELDAEAFYACRKVESIVLPAALNAEFATVQTMLDAFEGLKSIEVEKGGSTYASVGGMLTNEDKDTLLYCPRAYAGTVTISNGINTIGKQAFYARQQITAVTIPVWVTNIGEEAFLNCQSVEQITFRGSRSEDLLIGKSAFYGNYKLKNITFEGNGSDELDLGMITIGENAFRGYTDASKGIYPKLTSIDIGEGVKITGIGTRAFAQQTKLRDIKISENALIELIGKYAFEQCEQLIRLTIPGTVRCIDQYAFSNCAGLSSLNFDSKGAATLAIKEYAFQGCIKLTAVTLPDHLNSFVSTAFDGCNALKAITVHDTNPKFLSDANGILYKKNANNALTELLFYPQGLAKELGGVVSNLPETLTTIGGSAFTGNNFLVGVVIPKNVTNINISAFANCSALQTVTFEQDGVALVVGNNAFQNCISLENIELPAYTVSIGDNAFENCAFTSFVIPAKVTAIGQASFKNCTNLQTLTFLCERNLIISKGSTNAATGAFSGCTALKALHLPQGTSEIGKYAFANCTALESVNFAEDAILTTINNGAFSMCTSLKSIFIPKGVTTIGASAFAMETKNTGALENVIFELGGTAALTIGDAAFSYHPNLTTITFPARTTKLNSSSPKATSTSSLTIRNVFTGCNKLAAINIAEEDGIANSFASLDGVLYNSDYTALLYCPVANVGCYNANGEPTYELIVPNTVRTVMTYAFQNNTKLTTLTFQEFDKADANYGQQLLTIGNHLYSLKFAYTQKSSAPDYSAIGGKTTSITTVNLPSHLAMIKAAAFSCGSSTPITININPDADNIALGIYAFTYANVASLHFPGTLKSIDTYAFYCCTNLEQITLNFSTSITKLPDYTFKDCKKLSSFTIPKHFTEIGPYAFEGCASIKQITIPASVTTLNGYCFDGMGLESVTIPATVSALGTNVFHGNKNLKTVVFGLNAKGKSPIKKIPNQFFYGCVSLESINLHDLALTDIGNSAFFECTKLTDIDFTQLTALTTIGTTAFSYSGLVNADLSKTQITTLNNSFSDCAALEFMALPESLSSIKYRAFSDTPALKTIVVPTSFTGSQLTALEGKPVQIIIPAGNTNLVQDAYGVIYDPGFQVIYYACGANNDLTGYTIPKTVLTISSYAFAHATMEHLIIPEGVMTIDAYAFQNANIPFISIPSSVTRIEEGAFKGSSLRQVEFANEHSSRLEYLGALAFSESALERIVLPDNLAFTDADSCTSIFKDCKNLKSVTFGAATVNIPESIFIGCTALEELYLQEGIVSIPALFATREITEVGMLTTNQVKSIVIPASVRSLNQYAFAGFGMMETVTVAEGSQLTSIAPYAFATDGNLKHINLPAALSSIGTYAFYNCESLESLDLGDTTITRIIEYTFYNTKSLKTLVLPNNLQAIGAYAFYNVGVIDLVIPGTVNSIGNGAFENATSMKTLTFSYDSILEDLGDHEANSNIFRNSISLETLTLPNSLRFIGNQVFENSGVKTILIADPSTPSELGEIGKRAFANCENLTAFDYLQNVTMIGDEAFFCCSSLTNAMVYEGLESLGSMAFAFCTQLSAGYIPATLMDLGGNAYAGLDASKLQMHANNETLIMETDSNGAVSLYDSTKSVLYAVYGLNGSYTISDEVLYIAPGVFAGTGITEITLGSNVKTVVDYMFMNCQSLTSVTFEGEITSIGKYAFYNSAISEITIQDTVTEIADHAFAYCKNLNNVSIPATTLNLGNYCFAYCLSLSNFVFEENTGSDYQILGTHIFYNCPNITEVILPTQFKNTQEDQDAHASGGATSTLQIGAIPSYMFSGTGIVEAVLPASVKLHYTTGVFANCKNLTKIILLVHPTSASSAYAKFNPSWVEGCDQFQYYYSEYFTHNAAYLVAIMDESGVYELHMGTVFEQSENATVTAFSSIVRFPYVSENFRLYFDKMTYDQIIPYFHAIALHWDMKIFDMNGYELVCDEDTGSVAYVLDTEGNIVWEATADKTE